MIGTARKVVLAHRSLLSARCEIFRVMFTDKSQSHQDTEVPLVLSDMTIEIFMPMLEYIYTNCVTLTRKNVGRHYSSVLLRVNDNFYLFIYLVCDIYPGVPHQCAGTVLPGVRIHNICRTIMSSPKHYQLINHNADSIVLHAYSLHTMPTIEIMFFELRRFTMIRSIATAPPGDITTQMRIVI